MRVLFTVMPAAAHLYPIVPLAWALQCAGHEVCVASHPDMTGTITAAGLTAVPAGEEVNLSAAMRSAAGDERLARVTDALAADPADGDFLNAIRNYMLAGFSLYYPDYPAGRDDRRTMTDDLITFADAWRPDLVLWDSLSFPAPIAARTCGAAHARVLFGLDYFGWMRKRFNELPPQPTQRRRADPLAELMQPTLERFGCEFDDEMLLGQWTVDLLPPRMRLPLGLPSVSVRRVPYTGAAAVRGWLYERPAVPRVCLTLGISTRKFLAEASGSAVPELLAIAADLDIEVVATLNAAQLASVTSIPANVRLIDYVPLSLLLPTCSAIIHHGGGGTFAAAVADKVPQLIPAPGEGGDRKAFARYVEEQGAGLVLDGDQFSATALRKQLQRVLTEPSFAEGAAGLFAEMLATPSPDSIVPVLEKLTAERHR